MNLATVLTRAATGVDTPRIRFSPTNLTSAPGGA